jgi:peroxiredoxin family protein
MAIPKPLIVRETILEIVQNQIRDNDPPETKRTLERLAAAGISEPEAIKMIGCAVTAEIFDILKNRQGFDRERYVRNLGRLPRLPWE